MQPLATTKILYPLDTKTRSLATTKILYPLDTKTRSLAATKILSPLETKTQPLAATKILSPLETKTHPLTVMNRLCPGDTKMRLLTLTTTQALHQQRAWTHLLEQHGRLSLQPAGTAWFPLRQDGARLLLQDVLNGLYPAFAAPDAVMS